MSQGLGTMKAAMRMRDIIRTAISETLKKMEPQLGSVVSIDRANRAATVILNGDSAAIDVKMFRKQPLGVGDIVQVTGGPGKYVISDVLSTYGWEMTQWMHRLQMSLTGGGTVAFATNNFTWTVRFLAICVGDGPVFNTEFSYFAIGPCVGGVPVPRYNSPDLTPSTTIANGVTMAQSYEALYYELPLENAPSYVFDETRFRLVGYSGAERFDVPAHWLMVAVKNADASSGEILKIMNGKIITA